MVDLNGKIHVAESNLETIIFQAYFPVLSQSIDVSKTSSCVQGVEKNCLAVEAASLYCMYIYLNKGSLVVGQNDNTQKKTQERGKRWKRESFDHCVRVFDALEKEQEELGFYVSYAA